MQRESITLNHQFCYVDAPNCWSLKVREKDEFAKIVSSKDAATEPAGTHLRRVLANMPLSSIKLSHRALGAKLE